MNFRFVSGAVVHLYECKTCARLFLLIYLTFLQKQDDIFTILMPKCYNLNRMRNTFLSSL